MKIKTKLLIRQYRRTLMYVAYVIFFSALYAFTSYNLFLFFIGLGFGSMMTNYCCERFHTGGHLKQILDETLNQFIKEQEKHMQQFITALQNKHTEEVLNEAERIRKETK